VRTGPAAFQPRSIAEIDDLVAQHPLAQLISTGAGRFMCTPLPLLLERASADEAWLTGHFARTNPQVALLRRQPRALAVFMGAHGYISPSWMRDREQAPTWNYETAHFDIDIAFDDSEAATRDALERLVNHMERCRPQAWSIADMGSRYASLAGAVISFRARVVAVHAKFKLGQNEPDDAYTDILEGLARTGQQPLIDAMTRVDDRCIA
jgi:transcriptional regulator